MSSSTLWYYHKDDRGFGPVQEADIRGLLERNEIAADTLVWREGLSDWIEARSTELIGFSSDAALSPPPVSAVTSPRRKHSKLFPVASILAEVFNCLIFGVIPLFVVLALGVGGVNAGH
jgi:hypothetical protein